MMLQRRAARYIRRDQWYADAAHFSAPAKLDFKAWRSTRIAPLHEESYKRIERDLDILLNPNAKTQKKLEKALAKMMQIE